MVRLIKCLFFTILLFIISVAPVLAKDYSFPQVSFLVHLQPDGSAQVEEKRTYNFNGSFSWADEYIKVKSQNSKVKNYQITNVQVGDENGMYQQSPSQTAGTYYVTNQPDQTYIKWFYSATSTTKAFTITYTITDAIAVHQDIAEFYWQLVGEAWDKGVDQVNAVVYLPGEFGFGNNSDQVNAQQKIYAFGHGPLNGKINIASKNQINFSAQNLPQKTFFEVRVLFEKGLLDAGYQSRVSDNITLNQILTEEKKFGEQTDLKKKFSLGGLILAILFSLFAFLIFVKGFIQYLRDWWLFGKDQPLPLASLSGKLHEPPSDLIPSAVECLITGRAKITPKAVVASIINLVNKKIIKIQSKKKSDRNILGWSSTHYEYSLLLVKDPDKAKLTTAEKELIDFIFNDIARREKEVSFEDIKKYPQSNRMTAYNFFKDFQKDSFKECLDQNLYEPKSHIFSKKPGNIYLWGGLALNFVAAVFGPGLIAILGPVAGTIIGFNWLVFAPEVACLIIVIILSSFAEKRTPRGSQEATSWLAFQRYLKEYSVTRDYPIDSVILWGKYLVYGIVLGVSLKALSELPVNFSPEELRTAGFVFVSGSGPGDLSASFSNLSTTLSSLNTAFTASYGASGVGGSGGFSAGGGGGGGGGGGAG